VIAIYTLLVSFGVAAPIVTAVALGDRSESVLTHMEGLARSQQRHRDGRSVPLLRRILVGKGIAGM